MARWDPLARIGRGAWAALVLLIVLAGCSGGAARPAGATGAPAPAMGEEVEGGDEEPAVPAGTQAPVIGGDAQAPIDALVIRTGRLELEVADLALALDRARAVVASLGGYIAGSQEIDDGEHHRATITYRIAAERWDDALTGLRELADTVVRETTAADDVTAQVVDLGARIENLRAAEAALASIMERAATIDDVLKVQARLDEVRESIERLVAQQDDLSGRAALATLEVAWSAPPPPVPVAEAPPAWDARLEFERAAAATIAAGQLAASTVIWLLVVGVPLVVPLVVLALAGRVVARRVTQARRVA